MLPFVRRHLSVALTAAVVCTIFTAGPSLARAAFDANNADKVDGKHAVGADASISFRAGKLVATGARGQLPSDIIGVAQDAARLGGRPPGSYRVNGNGSVGSFANIDGCGSGVIHSYPLTLVRSARLFAAATTSTSGFPIGAAAQSPNSTARPIVRGASR